MHAHTWTSFGVAWLFNKTLSLQALSLNVESVHDRDRVPPPQLTEHIVQDPHPPITLISLCLIMRHMVHIKVCPRKNGPVLELSSVYYIQVI